MGLFRFYESLALHLIGKKSSKSLQILNKKIHCKGEGLNMKSKKVEKKS